MTRIRVICNILLYKHLFNLPDGKISYITNVPEAHIGILLDAIRHPKYYPTIIRELRKIGLVTRVIADILGISTSNVYYHLKKSTSADFSVSDITDYEITRLLDS